MIDTRPIRALLALCLAVSAVAVAQSDPALWPEEERAFLQDGPGLLLERDQRQDLEKMAPEERSRYVADFLARDPLPATPVNELTEGIERRRRLIRREFLSFADDRARLLFLRGAPAVRREIECGQVFVPLEIWSYPGAAAQLVLYRPSPGQPYRLWLPLDSKRALYQRDMVYWLQQWEELRGRISGRRFDLQACPSTPAVDDATGIEGLSGLREERPTNNQLLAFLAAPKDVAVWAADAAATELPEPQPDLQVADLELFFPDRIRQRIVTRFQLTLPPGAALQPVEEVEPEELRLSLDGVIEQEGQVFEEFRIRFRLPPPGDGAALALVFERPLRPQREFVLRFRLRDEGAGSEAVVNRGFAVPAEAQPVEEPPVPEGVILAMGEELAMTPLAGEDSLLLAPPSEDVILGVWRADALVTGQRIAKVVFLVDGEAQLTRTTPPFSAEVRLAKFPREQIVRAEGYDAAGELVDADEVVLNRPRGSFRVRIEEPRAGAAVSGTVTARAEVWVPEGRSVDSVEFRLNEEPIAVLSSPPWQTQIEVPGQGEIAFVTVVATLDNGQSTEAVRYLNAPQYLERVEVQLVELLTTVTDNSRRPVADLGREDFQVFEDGRPQQITRFEQVKDLPLTIGITIDTSGSMVDSLIEAKRAALGFLGAVLEPRDKAFAVSFAKEPQLLVPPTDDLGAIERSLDGLQSIGWTALHDAVVSSLYYFRAFRGQRALILLSDGDDSASHYPFRDALEYARRSGVVIYTVGLEVGSLKVAIRRKLTQLAEATGGRVFFIQRAQELSGVYREIEEELRSQYLLTYASDAAAGSDEFRSVEVKVRGGRYAARTIRGYFP